MPFTPDDMLRYSAVPGRPHVYVVGCVERRVTIRAQQVRALNLVHALFATGRLGYGQELVIVGAGFAGITAAVGAAVRGARVTVLECRESPLHLQRGVVDRWVHPHIYEWPGEGSEDDAAGLPVLNWRAGEVRHVVERLLQGWDAAVTQYPIKLHTGVAQVSISDLIVRWKSRSHREERQRCEAVLVAVGFGTEEGISYWKDDGLELVPTGAGAFQVSGIGDGGLVDALRLRLGNPDPGVRFFSWLSKEFLPAVPPEVRDAVLAAERGALAARDERAAALELESRYETIVADVRANYPLLSQLVAARIRRDTTVRLVGMLPAPYSPKASPLNRFTLALLRDVDDRFEYMEGEVDRGSGSLRDSHDNTIELSGRVHVMRLGPRPALEHSFRDIADHLRNDARLVGLDAPRMPIWEPSDFGVIDPMIADPGASP